MEDITLSITEAIACELALDEVLEGLRASSVRRKEGLTGREVALERMLVAARRSISAKRHAATRDLPWRVSIAAEVGLSTDEASEALPAVYDVGLEPGAEPPDDDPTAHEQGREEF